MPTTIQEALLTAVVTKIKEKEAERQEKLRNGEDVAEVTALIDNWMNAASQMGAR